MHFSLAPDWLLAATFWFLTCDWLALCAFFPQTGQITDDMCLRGGDYTDFIIYKNEMTNYSTTRHHQQQDIRSTAVKRQRCRALFLVSLFHLQNSYSVQCLINQQRNNLFSYYFCFQPDLNQNIIASMLYFTNTSCSINFMLY